MKTIKSYQIQMGSSIEETFLKIDENQSGAIFVVDEDLKVVGVATDGDIRRHLLKSPDLKDPIEKCMNKTFVFVTPQTPREQILKILDRNINVIPMIDPSGRLFEVLTRQSFPLSAERSSYAMSRAPARISFMGGGTDLTHFFTDEGGAVMNATISRYAHAVLKKRNDSSIRVFSRDLNRELLAADLNSLGSQATTLPLISSLIQLIRPGYGFDLQVGTDFPVGSGLGGSAVVSAAIIGCFNEFREDRWDNYEMAEIAFQSERLVLEVAGGWQDQYATVFGGFNFMEFSEDQNIVHPLRIAPQILRELESSLLLCYTGLLHSSGDIHEEQKKNMEQDAGLRDLVKRNKKLAYQMKSHLMRGQLKDFGAALHEGWELKKQFGRSITSSKLDDIYAYGLANGALGGKILGAGGGGFFLFYVRPLQRYALEAALQKKGLQVQPFSFEEDGLLSWKVRDYE